MVKQVITINGVRTTTSRKVDVEKARAWLDNLERQWTAALITPEDLAAQRAVSDFPLNRAQSLARVSPDRLEVLNSENLRMVIENFPLR